MHDTRYYGRDIIEIINKTLECRPLVYRKSICIWASNGGLRAILLDLDGHNRAGYLEVFIDGDFSVSLFDGVLSWDDDKADWFLDETKITEFLNKHKGLD